MLRRKSGKTCISDVQVLACGVFFKGYPRYDTLWEGLSKLGLAQLIDLRFVKDFSDVVLNEEEKRNRKVLHRLGGRIKKVCFYFGYLMRIARAARERKVDVIFTFHGNHLLEICLAILKLYHGAKVYHDLFNSVYSIATANSLPKFIVILSYVREFLSIKFGDQLIAHSPEYIEYYRNLYKIGGDKISLVPDGVQHIWFDEPKSVSHESGYPRRVLYWGGFGIQGGFDLILGAAEELRNNDVEFVLCGRGGMETWVKEQASKMNLSNVVFKGFVPTTKELIHIVDSADVTLGLLGDIHDTKLVTSNKAKQGMARGKPVITIWAKQKEDLYLKDNPFPLPPLILIDPDAKSLAKAIMEVINSPERAEQIGSIARSTVERLHSQEVVTSALEKALEKILEDSRRVEVG